MFFSSIHHSKTSCSFFHLVFLPVFHISISILLKAFIYNCPYLIAISLTSIAVMFASDEIGISAIARDAQTFVCKSYAKMPGERDALATISNGLMQDDNRNTSDINNMSDAEESEENRNTEEAQTENTLSGGDAADSECGDPDVYKRQPLDAAMFQSSRLSFY